jgi:hypothetical protein
VKGREREKIKEAEISSPPSPNRRVKRVMPNAFSYVFEYGYCYCAGGLIFDILNILLKETCLNYRGYQHAHQQKGFYSN